MKKLVIIALGMYLCSCVTVIQSKRELSDEQKEAAAKDRLKLGLAYLDKGMRQKAKQNLDKAYEHNPDSTAVNFGMAYFYQQVGELQKAEIHYKVAIDNGDGDADAHNNYGAFLCQQARYEEAETQFKQAIQIATYLNVATTYENLGLCSVRARDYTSAGNYFEKALEHDPLLSSAALRLVELAILQENYELANKQMDRYLAKTKGHTITSVDMAITIALNQQDLQEVDALREIKRKIEDLNKQ